MQDRAAVLPVQVTPDAGKQRLLYNTILNTHHYTLHRYTLHHFTITQFKTHRNKIQFPTIIFQCLNCGSSLAEQNSEAAGPSDPTDLVPPEVGIVDKQAMVEDWLNPEPEVGGEFAPQVQHYLAGQAGPPDCACRPPSGPSAQQKISKVGKYFCLAVLG